MTVRAPPLATHSDRYRGFYSEHLQQALSQADQALMGLAFSSLFPLVIGPDVCSCIYFVNKTFVASSYHSWGRLDCRVGQVAGSSTSYLM